VISVVGHALQPYINFTPHEPSVLRDDPGSVVHLDNAIKVVRVSVCFTRHDPSWKPEPSAPIDYCYVRPHHIPAVNALCREYFWPGIDS